MKQGEYPISIDFKDSRFTITASRSAVLFSLFCFILAAFVGGAIKHSEVILTIGADGTAREIISWRGFVLASGEVSTNKDDNAHGDQDGPVLTSSLATFSGSSLIASASPLGAVVEQASIGGSPIGIMTYTVKEGDTVSTIAEQFGISVDTILWENKMSERSTLRVGSKLTILPLDGVKHIVKSGDTISDIADRYSGDEQEIATTNNLSLERTLAVGDTILVPGGRPTKTTQRASSGGSASPVNTRALVDVTGYFAMPAQGRRTQGLHRYNAVDLGGSKFCGTPLVAAAAGTVITSQGGWNGGYGNYIKISHPNGTVTLYAHNAQNLVTVGQTVTQGQTIGYLGTTGNSTGCHVHFEVRGANNPFVN